MLIQCKHNKISYRKDLSKAIKMMNFVSFQIEYKRYEAGFKVINKYNKYSTNSLTSYQLINMHKIM